MKVYGKPLFYWVVATIGLVMALVSHGLGDVLGLLLLTLPLVRVLVALLSLRTMRR